MSSDLKVKTALTMTQGNIATGNYTLTIGSGTGAVGSLSRTSGTVIGNFKRWFAAATVSDALFPIGTATYYRPASISFTAGPNPGGTLLAIFTAADPGSAGLPVSDRSYVINKIAPDGYWTLTTGDGLGSGTYSLDLTATSFSGIYDYTDLHLLKQDNSSSNWAVSGSHSAGTGSASAPIVHRTALTSFSEFGIGSNQSDNSLPVSITSFNAEVSGGVVKLIWTTASETENLGFILERKTVETNCNLPSDWSQIANYQSDEALAGHGSTSEKHTNQFIGMSVQPGVINFYRLSDVSYDGKITRQKEIEIEVVAAGEPIPLAFKLEPAFPNPFNPVTTIKFNLPYQA